MKIIIILLITLSSCMLFAQEKKTTKTKEAMSLQEIDELPIYPGCKGSPKVNTCLNRSIQKHIRRKFNGDFANELGLESGKKRIYVMFTINKEGVVENIKARAPHPVLVEEAERVVRLLPKMIPGKQKGKPVNVKYMLPINFIVEGDSYNKRFDKMNDKEVPIYPGCDSIATNLPKKCFEEKITAHIIKNLKKELANELNLESDKKIVYARFTIDENGKIIEVGTVNQHKVLREEVERVLNLLPTMKPTKVADKLVKVEYFLTIDFEKKKGIKNLK